MSLLVFGATGQLAVALRASAPDALFLNRDAADLTDPDTCAAAIHAAEPSAVINAAAYTAVDRAEEEEALATVINAAAPGAMARACAEASIPFLHVSTDYVFDGRGQRPWRPEDPTSPLNAYGRSKAAGEAAVRAAGGPHAILRTSWVFSATGRNFVTAMLELAQKRDRLNVVDDQIGGPTSARAIGEALLKMAEAMVAGQSGGTYHFAGAPFVSWKGVACGTFACSGQKVTVSGIPTSEYPTAAQRPLNSRLDCTSLEADFGIRRPDWQAELAEVVEKMI
ncbi:dTDP-4-dehydrorhamnose reductase (plasmid) [Sulfitobacter sp. OXR-159]|uniref:dTDP-4-dehydrorhamnose reductase n=1 Tax=Sulfitobacter sp. OXR-159 TaxID=3100174 RepID=UPI002AC9E5E0|nr:dTDP-4-dehydrorhamnose reductase [Sulfitobacter sp. OXR-159]WPZ31613.1 dTDP-4-dehydrorhamnose reductase [Sulfitobacter sp. OXR-159]